MTIVWDYNTMDHDGNGCKLIAMTVSYIYNKSGVYTIAIYMFEMSDV